MEEIFYKHVWKHTVNGEHGMSLGMGRKLSKIEVTQKCSASLEQLLWTHSDAPTLSFKKPKGTYIHHSFIFEHMKIVSE